MNCLIRPLFFLLVLTFSMQWNEASAGHVAGVNISYNKISSDSFEISVDVIRDCGNISWNSRQINVDVTNPCNYFSSVQLDLVPAKYSNPFTGVKTRVFSNACQSSQNNLMCDRGQLQSFEVYTYKGVFVLPGGQNCKEWLFTYTPPCCVNNNFVNVPGFINFKFEANATYLVDSVSENQTIEKTTIPIYYGCVNQKNGFSLADKNPDQDSLVYFFSIDTGSVAHQYRPPNIFGPSTELDSATGFFTFTPPSVGDYYLPIKVCEYDKKTKKLKGCIYRVTQMTIANCSNKLPDTSGVVSNVSSNATRLGDYSLEVCAGSSFSFETYFSDPDTSDSVHIYTNLTDIIPWAQLSEVYSSGTNDTVKTTITGSIPDSIPDGIYSFYIRATDNVCPMLGQRSWQYNIHVKERTSAVENKGVCKGVEWVDLGATGGTQFKWKVLSGSSFDTISTSTGYNATATVHGENGFIRVSPASTTTYEVTALDRQQCINKDTVVVKVGPDFSWSSTHKDKLCYGESPMIDVSPSGGGASNFTFNWFPKNLIDSTNGGMAFTHPVKETTEILVSIESSLGCVKRDTLSLKVMSNPFPKDITIHPGISQICNQDTLELSAKLANLDLVNTCGLARYPCQGNQQNVTSSTGGIYNVVQKNNLTLPNIGTVGYWGTKNQYLYRASRLKSMGLKAGYISSLSFDVSRNANADSVLNNLVVRIKCDTSDKFYSTNFLAGAVEVCHLTSDTIDDNWWEIVFDQSYYWDGQSNLVIEVYWNNSSVSNENQVMNFLSTSYPSALQYLQQSSTSLLPEFASGASRNGPSLHNNPYSFVPVIRFKSCQGIDTAGFTFNWNVSNGQGILGASNNSSVSFYNQNVGNYQLSLVVNDTSGFCTDTVRRTISIDSTYPTRPMSNSLEVCISDQSFPLKTPLISSSVSKQWGGNGVTSGSSGAIFSPSSAGVGVHKIYLEIPGNNCGVKDTFDMRVSQHFDASFGLDRVCMSDSLVGLQPTTPNGKWIGAGVFDSSIAQLEISKIGLSLGSGEIDSVPITHLVDSLGCFSSFQKKVKVYGEFIPELDMSGAENPLHICSNGGVRYLELKEGQGTWSGPGIATNGEFYPAIAGNGTHTIVADSLGFCAGSSIFTVEVPKLIEPIIDNPGPFCDLQHVGVVSLTANVAGIWSAPYSSGAGSWTPTAVSGSFVPSTVVQNYGHGYYPMILNAPDTIFKDSNHLNVCWVKDTAQISFVEEIEIDLGPDVPTCGKAVDSILDVGIGGQVLWSTGDTTASIRVTSLGTYWVTKQGFGTNCMGTDTITFHSGCLSVKPVGSSSGVSIYPNPTQTNFNVMSNGTKISAVSVISMEGKTVYQLSNINAVHHSVSVEEWPAGVYSVICTIDNQTVVRRINVY